MAVEWKYGIVDLSDDITTIENAPCLVKGVYINTALSAHPCPIEDGTLQPFVIPASATPGSAFAFGPARFEDKLIVDPDNAATGNITVVYVRMDEPHG